MPDVNSVVSAVLAVVAPIAATISIGGRRRRQRHEIRENLALIEDIQKNEALAQVGLVSGWLHGRIALDVAKLTGQTLGSDKKPIPWGSVIWTSIFVAVFGAITYYLNRDGFVWYSVFPGLVAATLAFSVFGMFVGRDQPPGGASGLPLGAVAAPTETANEQVATALAIQASGGTDDRLNPGKQADVVLRFIHLLQGGAYGAATELADQNWRVCRLRAWLWNNRDRLGIDEADLSEYLEAMMSDGTVHSRWADFVETETRQFLDIFADVDLSSYGIAGRRRRIAADMDLVILLPVGSSGGYFVMSATAIPDALTFLVRYTDEGWRIAALNAMTPPLQGWPPIWWTTDDPAIEALPDPDRPTEPMSDRSQGTDS